MAERNNNKLGKIIVPTNVFPEKHELVTANYFTNLGKDVEFLLPSGEKTADIIVDGIIWEIKAPKGTGSRTLEKRSPVRSQAVAEYYLRFTTHKNAPAKMYHRAKQTI